MRESRDGSSPPSPRPWANGWRTTNVCDAWPLRRHADLRLPSQPQSVTAHWLVPNYTAWWQMHTCINNLPRVAFDSGVARIWTRNLLIASPAPYRHSIKPHIPTEAKTKNSLSRLYVWSDVMPLTHNSELRIGALQHAQGSKSTPPAYQ